MNQDTIDILQKTPVLGATPVTRVEDELASDPDKTMLLPGLDYDLRLIITDLADNAHQTFASTPVKLGRDEGNDLIIDDKTVSRQHAIINYDGFAWVIENLSHSNVLRVNQHPVTRVILDQGDTIALGSKSYRIDFESSSSHPDAASYTTSAHAEQGDKRHRNYRKWGLLAATMVCVLVTAALLVRNMHVEARVHAVATKSETSQEPQPLMVNAASDRTTKPEKAIPAHDELVKDRADGQPLPAADTIETSTRKTTTSKHIRVHTKQVITKSPETIISTRKQVRVVQSSQSNYLASEHVSLLEQDATDAYLRGDIQSSISGLNHRLHSLSKADPAYERLHSLRAKLQALADLYEQGNSALRQGQQEKAMHLWLKFIQTEKGLIPKNESRYRLQVKAKLMHILTNEGIVAEAGGDYHKAYQYWHYASKIEAKSAATDKLNVLKERAKNLYQEAYRLESVNIQKAMVLWHSVTQIVPRSDEYNLKANSKLAWYAYVQD